MTWSHLQGTVHACAGNCRWSHRARIPRSYREEMIRIKLSEALRGFNSHADVVRSLFKPKVLYDIWMVKILQCLRFQFQCIHNCVLPRIVFITCCLRKFYLLNGNHLSCRCVHGKIHTTICPLSNQLATDPFKCGCKRVKKSFRSRILQLTPTG